jgi:hypothetical protein
VVRRFEEALRRFEEEVLRYNRWLEESASHLSQSNTVN